MTSSILSCPINVNEFGLIYAGTQKNIGQAGMTVVIIREDLIKEALPFTPTLYSYKTMTEYHSFYNTPPTYNWYITGLVLDWMKKQGGVEVFYQANKRKADKIYSLIDSHAGFYVNKIMPACRSLMNIMFYLQDEALTPVFLKEAAEIGLTHLRGHKISGGIRASMYNAMPEEGANVLADFMLDFAKRNG